MNAQTQTLAKSLQPRHLWTGSPVCSERAGGPKLPGEGWNPVTQPHSRVAGMTSLQAGDDRHALNTPASPPWIPAFACLLQAGRNDDVGA